MVERWQDAYREHKEINAAPLSIEECEKIAKQIQRSDIGIGTPVRMAINAIIHIYARTTGS